MNTSTPDMHMHMQTDVHTHTLVHADNPHHTHSDMFSKTSGEMRETARMCNRNVQ